MTAAAGSFGVLLDRLIFIAVHFECHGSEMLGTGAAARIPYRRSLSLPLAVLLLLKMGSVLELSEAREEKRRRGNPEDKRGLAARLYSEVHAQNKNGVYFLTICGTSCGGPMPVCRHMRRRRRHAVP